MLILAGLVDWINAISQLLFTVVFLLLFLGFNQRLQVFLQSRNISAKLKVLETYALESKQKTIEFLKNNGSQNPESVFNTASEYFVISPVDIEPTDIIRRLETLLRTQETRFEKLVEETLPNTDKFTRSLALTALEISAALNQVYKIVRHYLLLGRKTNNWILIMQLDMLMPTLLRQAKSYRQALDVFLEGKPIGDGAGPLLAFNIVKLSQPTEEISKDTVYYTTSIEERTVYVVKAKGPQSNVGHPGEAVEKLVEKLISNGKEIGLIITVDAALKLEGEETGSIAEGVGAAIGDPGPEKIRIERIAAKYGIPLHAVVIKMGFEEAILEMKKQVVEGVEKAMEVVRELIRKVPKEKAIIIAGIGNTIGIA
ncbi:MAG: DUF1512 domain-containing protein [Fervidicoccaceae archaeon]|nr:DUF1512 domain-containing protein [Fervidicoccaceae archaeon]